MKLPFIREIQDYNDLSPVEDNLVDTVNDIVDAFQSLLNGQLEFGDNVLGKVMDIRISDNDYTYKIANPLPKDPKGVFPLRIQQDPDFLALR